MIDRAMAYVAALDALKAGGSAEDAYEAAACALRPNGIPDWIETPVARWEAESAIESFAAEASVSRGAA